MSPPRRSHRMLLPGAPQRVAGYLRGLHCKVQHVQGT